MEMVRTMPARFTALLFVAGLASSLDNGVGLTPPMGFNTYQSPWPFQGGFAPKIGEALTDFGFKARG